MWWHVERRWPRLPYAVHLALGAALAALVAPSLAPWPGALLAGALVLGVGAALALLRPGRSRAAAWVLLGLSAGASSVGVGAAERVNGGHIANHLASWPDSLEVRARGCLDRGARRTERGFRARLDLSALRSRGDGWETVRGRVSVWWPDGHMDLVIGTCLEVRGELIGVTPTSLPFGPDPGARDERDGIAGTIYVEDPARDLSIRGSEGDVAALGGLVDAARLEREEAVLAAGPPRAAAWILAVGSGSRAHLPSADRDRMAAAGIAHLLAVSGLHLALFVLSLRCLLHWLLGWAGRLGARVRSSTGGGLVIVATAFGYALFTGLGTAVLRAALFVAVLVGAELAGRPRSLAAAVGIAGAVILVYSPGELSGASFQLSFAAVIGIGVAGRRARPAAERPSGRWRARWRSAKEGAAAAVRIALGAWLATAPVLAWHFGELPLTGVVANVLIAPILALTLLPLAGAALLVAPASPDLAHGLGIAVEWVLEGAFAVLDPLVTLAGDPQPVGRPGGLELLGCFALLLALAALNLRPRLARSGKRLAALATGLVVILATARTWPPPTLEVWFLPVGQGDATLLRLPSGHVVLVDTGGARGRHPGREVVVPTLRGLAVRRLDLLVVTHGDLDHAGDLAEVVAAYPPRELWIGEGLAERPGLADLFGRLRGGGTAIRVFGGVGRREFRLGTTSLSLLHPLPPDGRPSYPELGENDNSLVLLVEDHGRRVLLPGDLEREGEARLLADWSGSLRADLMKVPHHGSRSSSSGALLLEVMPSLAVFPVGAANRFGFPHPEVEARYRRLGIGTLRTDRDGLVVVRLGPTGTAVWTARP